MSPATSSTILEARRGLTVGAGGWFGQPVCTDAVKVKVMVFVLIILLQHLSKMESIDCLFIIIQRTNHVE